VKIVLLHDASASDGRVDELDALEQVEVVASTLRRLGHETTTLGFGLDLESVRRELIEIDPDLVFNLVESVGGEGRLIHLAPALLDSLGIPYTGAPTEAMFLTSHKILAKRMLARSGERTPTWMDEDGRAGGEIAYPARFIVKSVWEDASLGLDDDTVVEVEGPDALRECIRSRKSSLGGEAFAEAWVEGREFNLALLELEGRWACLPVPEMLFVDYPAGKPKLVGYRAKWDDASFEATHTMRSFDLDPRDRVLHRELEVLARRVCRQFGLRGYARVDVRVDSQGRPWILELNANPCLSLDAGYIAAAEQAGHDAPFVVDAIVRAASIPLSEPARRS